VRCQHLAQQVAASLHDILTLVEIEVEFGGTPA